MNRPRQLDTGECAITTTSPPVTRAETPPGPRQWRVLAVVLIAAFMAVFDLYVVNIATPTLRADLHAGDGALELIVAGYAFAYAAGMVTGGRLGDRFGYRRIFALGMLGFTLASLLCALSTTANELIAARIVQGAAAAVMVPQVLSVITVSFPASHRGRATAWYGAVSGAGALVGQIAGGLLLDANPFDLGWRTIFLVNVPVGVVAIILVLRVLPRDGGGRETTLDPVGAIAVPSTLALVMIPLALGRQAGWPLWTWVCLTAAVPVGAAALAWQRRIRQRGGDPILDLRLLSIRPYTRLLGAASLYQVYFGSFLFTLTLLVQVHFAASPREAAAVFLLQGLFFTVASLLSGALVLRYGTTVLFVGGGLVIAGLSAMIIELTVESAHPTAGWLVPPLALIGLGNGLLLPSLLGRTLSNVEPAQAGAASGMLNTAQQFAGSFGITLVGTLFLTLAGPTLSAAPTAMTATAALDIALTVALLRLAYTATRSGPAQSPTRAALVPGRSRD
ncbi:MFS transporter [Nocardia otitidiscaviarum]|uniref:MFS transporter n=1 Tax=Nocardia otitidiscaviarum TaxID=1823 RepID=A0A516NFY2_9NOCA|nr:MFS transporter [Nocardia otitidiscaviarum]MCP9623158.1 MFS transporter [Nocardia otitidiscaviarum]QDP77812.1 MFS transporter [Nocardia otitidiscaviarum]